MMHANQAASLKSPFEHLMRSILSILCCFPFLNLFPLLIPSVLHHGGFRSPTSGSHHVDAGESDDEGEERQTPQEEDEYLLHDGHVLVVGSWNEEQSTVVMETHHLPPDFSCSGA